MRRTRAFDVPGHCFGILLLYLITNPTNIICLRAVEPQICTVSGFSFLRHETNCSKYYVCSHGKAFIMECPNGLYFDVKYNVCNWNNLVECSSISEETTTVTDSTPTTTFTAEDTSPTTQSTVEETEEYPTDEMKCQNGEDSKCHQYPTDCKKFYICEKGQAIIYSCDEGMYFNKEGCYCDSISQTNC